MKALLKLFDATLLDSNECHLHYYDCRHSLNAIPSFFWTLNQNKFPKNLGTFKISYFLPKLLESYAT